MSNQLPFQSVFKGPFHRGSAGKVYLQGMQGEIIKGSAKHYGAGVAGSTCYTARGLRAEDRKPTTTHN
jgi:hypothetical protein